MQSTRSGSVPEYIGADLTDRYSAQCRYIDVCGLTPSGNNRLHAAFWYWSWDPAPQPLDVAAIARELRAARLAMLDGPQALARKGSALRVCERQSAAVGKTPDKRPTNFFNGRDLVWPQAATPDEIKACEAREAQKRQR